ncbi:MAG: PhoU domain-containing protein [Candidatus Thorarchaeota archaeon]
MSDITENLEEIHNIASSSLIEVVTAFEDLNLEMAESIESKTEDLEFKTNAFEDMIVDAMNCEKPDPEYLRSLITYLQISNHLYRVGEYASKIARIVLLCGDMDHFKELESLPYLAELAKNSLDMSLKAVLSGDFSDIDELEKIEAESDRETSEMFDEVSEFLRQERNIGTMAMFYVIVGRYCERATDEALAIAERGMYLKTGIRKKLGLEYRYGASEAPH